VKFKHDGADGGRLVPSGYCYQAIEVRHPR